MINSQKKITYEGLKSSSAKLLPKGSILLSSRATIGRSSITTDESTTNQGFQSLIIEDDIDSEFIYYLISNITKELIKRASGSTFLEITKKEMSKININIPSINEQGKIAIFLSKVDEKIVLLEENIKLWESYKKGIMQQLFAQKLRFKNANNENYPNWEDMKMENLVEKYDKRVENPEDSSHILSSTLSGITLQKDYFDRQTASDNIVGYKFVPKGYFTYRSMSDTGIFRFNIQELIDNGIVSPAYPVFIEKRKIVNKYFLFYYLNYFPSIKKQILTLKEGGTRYALSFSKFNKFSVQLPVLDEQEKIANFLTNIDNKIEHITIEFKEMKLFKKGLLQQMFIYIIIEFINILLNNKN